MLEYQKSRRHRTALGPGHGVRVRDAEDKSPSARQVVPGLGDFWYPSMNPSREPPVALR
jgi:hypothetical protein